MTYELRYKGTVLHRGEIQEMIERAYSLGAITRINPWTTKTDFFGAVVIYYADGYEIRPVKENPVKK